MSNKNASSGALVEDLKVSFKFAFKNIISFLLGMIGVLIVTGIVMGVVFGIIAIPLLIYYGGFAGFVALFENLGIALSSAFTAGGLPNPAGILFLILGITIIASPMFTAVGALFGMGREIVESAGTSAEGVFTWYRKKFFSLAGGGIVLFLFVLAPIFLVWWAFSSVFGLTITGIPAAVLTTISGFWIVFSLGLLSMLFPAIIDNLSVVQATKTSIRMSLKYFDRVFSLWLALLGILGALLVPLVTAIPLGMSDVGLMVMAVYAIPAGIFLVLIWLPALAIALSRVYMILSGIEPSVEEKTEPDVSFVGGL
ncbi:MAG: hypothetical protein ACXABV_05235 [Candidatus Thorarchaeota archaeon]|jgi:hypothetical protein